MRTHVFGAFLKGADLYALHKIAGHALLTWTGKHLPCVWEAKYLPLDDGKRGYYTVRPRDISCVTIRSAAYISHPSQSSCRGGRPHPPSRRKARNGGGDGLLRRRPSRTHPVRGGVPDAPRAAICGHVYSSGADDAASGDVRPLRRCAPAPLDKGSDLRVPLRRKSRPVWLPGGLRYSITQREVSHCQRRHAAYIILRKRAVRSSMLVSLGLPGRQASS